MKILAIGNSFSEDATHFLHDILSASGIESKVVNLYIGGCSLERHWQNIEGDRRDYQYQLNGRKTDRYVSIGEVLAEESFDAVVTHQASHDSGWKCSYEPFLGLMLDYLKERSSARIFLNETWAYETTSPHPNFMRYSRSQDTMFSALKEAYEEEAARYGLPLIRSGEAVQLIRALPAFTSGDLRITRDGYHMHLLYGRYAVALLWAAKIAGIDVKSNGFFPQEDFMPGLRAEKAVLDAVRDAVECVSHIDGLFSGL